ncbi:hypothetical protein GGR52DRAFT_570470 [Hypoxylon sp. FL1284]|nr:hypothetical protein GGR52DRAFT_570470 [Hypoxylon sp. FL1284]
MHSLAIPTTLLPLLSLALGRPLEPRDTAEFTITSLSGTFPSPPPYGVPSVNSSVSIAVTYPDPSSATGATLDTSCKVGWPAGTTPGPTAWTPCDDSTLQFRMTADGWTSYANFEVELWETMTAEGAGLDATQIIRSDPGNSSDPNAYMFCLQKGKFNPTTCSLDGPLGTTPRTIVMTPITESSRPN